MRRRAGHDRAYEILARHLRERDQLHVPDRDGVEGDVDAPRLLRYGLSMLLDGLLVEGVYSGRLGRSPRGGDLLSHRFDLGKRAAGEKDPRPLAGEGTGDGAADRSSRPVNHRVLGLEQHFRPPLSIGLLHQLVAAYGNSPEKQLINLRNQLTKSRSGLLMVKSRAWRPCVRTTTGAPPPTPSTWSESVGRCWWCASCCSVPSASPTCEQACTTPAPMSSPSACASSSKRGSYGAGSFPRLRHHGSTS